MIQAIRLFLYPGVNATIRVAGRSPIFNKYIGWNDSSVGFDYTLSANAITEANEQPANNVPTFTPPFVPPTGQNDAVWFPWYDSTTGKWVQSYVDNNILYNTYGEVQFSAIGWDESVYSAVISAQLDPMQDPNWGTSQTFTGGSNIIDFPNAKTAQVIVNAVPTGFGTFWDVADSGKYGWVCAGHGSAGTADANLDWDQVQFVNFARGRFQFNPGT